MTHSPVIIKISGHNIADHDFLTELAEVIRDFTEPVILIHGGGDEITNLQAIMGIKPQYVDGIRITDAETLSLVEMVLCGVVNKRLVRYLVNAGVDAVGMSGVDRGLLRAVKYPHPTQDMGYTGQITEVRGDLIQDILGQGVTPVIAPVCMGSDAPHSYNVNADHVTGAVAAAVNASRIIFVTNVEGVMVNGATRGHLDALETKQLIDDGTISGGMIPKVTTALSALDIGVPEAVITNLQGFKTHGGTVFSRAPLPTR